MNKREEKLYRLRKGTVTIPMVTYYELVEASNQLDSILNDEDPNWTYIYEGEGV